MNIILVTYNQEELVKEAAKSIIAQELPYSYEVIVADDYSQDKRIDSIKNIFDINNVNYRVLNSERNLGISYNYKRAFEACDAEYVAVLEGDDYWTDPKRLLKHIEFLDNNPDVVLTSNRFWRLKDNQFIEEPNNNFEDNIFVFDTKQLVLNNYLSNLSTCVFRKSALNQLKPDIYDLEIADWMLGMALGEIGKLVKLNEIMSVFRIHKNGSWNGNSPLDNLNRLIRLTIPKYNEYLGYRYDKEFNSIRMKLRIEKILILILNLIPISIKKIIKKILFAILKMKF